MASGIRNNVLGVYKNMLKLAATLPEPRKSSSLLEIRKQFRAHKEISAAEIQQLLEKANSSLGYLKIICPRSKVTTGNQTGVTRIVFGSTDKGRKAVSNWTGSNMDPDSVKRHYQGLKRAGFTDNRSAKGIF